MCHHRRHDNMGQSTFDDDDLFGEAADEVREDIEAALADARASLPDPDDVWEADADNVLGVLNGLRSAMDPGEAEEHLRDAKKWYAMGERAHAFADADELQAEIEAVEEVVAEMRTAREQVSDLAGTVPELRSALEDAREVAGDGEETTDESGDEEEAEADDGADAEADEEGDAAADADEEAAADGGVASGASDTSSDQESDGGEPQDDEQATLDADDD
jgi:hypothetical protein